MRRRGPWRTLRGRLALAVGAGLLTAAIVFAAVAAGLIRSQSQVVARAELDRQTMALADALGDQAQERASRGEALQLDSQAYLDVIGGPRTRIYYSGLPLSPLAQQPSDEVPSTITISPADLQEDGVQRVEFSSPAGDGPLEGSVAPVHVGNEVWGHLVLARPPGEFASAWPDVAERVLLAAGVGLGVALLLSLFLTGRVTRPLTAMQAATHRVAAGNLRTQLGPTGTRELDELAADFNRMVRDLARRDGATREFLMRITHDLRTPLTAIRGHAAALSDGVVPDADVPRSLQAIESEAGRLEGLVADLLDLARIDAKHFRVEVAPIATAAALARAFDAMEAHATPRGIVYESQIDELPSIVTDEARLRQIVGNLLDNAIHWTPTGGTVQMEARPGADGGVVVTVSDSGPGIPLERREEIFTPFASQETPRGHRGAGLGLAISRELARALGGDLRVEARLREGSRFVLELPAAAPADAAAAAPAGP